MPKEQGVPRRAGDDALRYAFEDCVFDTDRRELRRGSGIVPTTPQAFDLLEYLIRNRERVVSKNDLVAAIWKGRAISDAALTTRLNAARAAIGDSGEEQRLIKTLQRRGFRFICAVRELPAPASAAVVETADQPALPPTSTNRRLAAIVFGDLAGYYAAMKRDEEGTAAAVRAMRTKVIEPKLAEYQGRLVVAVTDSFIAEFASPLAALKCALAIQSQLTTENIIALKLRIGVNLGDIIVEDGGNVHGEGVMVASRLQALADPGGILMSDKIFREIEGKLDAAFEDRGELTVTNVLRPLRVYHTRP
jgi:class 3 adenylate cyclase